MISFRGFITELAKFSPKNFPAAGNEKFNGAGERTTYTPTSTSTSFKYRDGFPLEKDTVLYDDNGRVIKTIRKNTKVHFVHPAKLFRNDELGIRLRGTYAAISTKSHNSDPEGFVAINSVIKPAGSSQNRVSAGAATQNLIATKVEEIAFKNGQNYEFVSTAKIGSTVPDLIVTIDGKRIQFEIKGTNSTAAPITFFDKSVNRKKSAPELINNIAKAFAEGNKLPIPTNKRDIAGVIDYYRIKDPSVGLAGDAGAPKSGKLPKEFTTTSRAMLQKMRKLIMDHFAEGKDNYFVVHNRSNDSLQMFFTGYGENVLKLPELPEFKSFSLATYGGASSGSTRVGLKIKL